MIIGAEKSGTTALSIFLSKHPDVCDEWRELYFYNSNFHMGKEWYQRQIQKRSGGKFVCHKNPNNLFMPHIPERVHSFYPDMKLIVLLRNPVDRAYSGYQMAKARGWVKCSFEEELQMEERLLKSRQKRMLSNPTEFWRRHYRKAHRTRGIYVDQVGRWFDYFPREQFLFLSFEEFLRSPETTMKKVFHFLGLKEHEMEYPSCERNYPEMAPETRAKLVEFYRPYNEELEELLDMKFNWEKS